ncbi:MAG: hypothetical protein IH957_13190 [Chloroflexi bacterium]|nr:hypothetical protein [Chloroflexota bacterium]
MAYVEITAGWACVIVGALAVYAGLYNRNPLPARVGAVVQVPVAMVGAGAWLVRTGVRVSLGGPNKAKARR